MYRAFLAAAIGLAWSAQVSAQAPNEFDYDPASAAAVAIAPNGATHVVTGQVTYSGQHLTLNAPLEIAAGAELRLVRSALRVFGSVTLREGGRLSVIDSSLLLPCSFQRQYEFRTEGGLLHTERAVIGSGYVGSNLSITRLLHLRGTWLARETVLQGLVTILADGRNGWFGDARYKGGSVVARGLYEGDRADAIHMSGMGDVTLVDGTMNVGFYYDAAAAAATSTTTVDLSARVPLTITYGDPTLHTGLTQAVDGMGGRLQLTNHRSPGWQFFAVNATSSGPLHTLTLRNAEDIICNFRGIDLVGSPVLGGPWSSYYAELPGLPSTSRPGHHAMPPGCSVRLGNVQFQSGPGPNDWNRIRSWGLYARGLATNLSVTGPTLLAELQLVDGQIHLQGAGSFDMGVFANTVRLYQTAQMHVQNGALGEFGVPTFTTALIEANDAAQAILSNVRTGPMRLRTTNAAAAITATSVFGIGNLIVDNAGGGTVSVQQATPAQSSDLQNLGFDSSPLLGGVPPYWSGVGVSGVLVPQSVAGTYSYRGVFAANGTLAKVPQVPPGTLLDVLGVATLVTPPATGTLALQVLQGAVAAQSAVGATVGVPTVVQVPNFTVPALGPTTIRWLGAPASATLELDHMRVQVGNWWDADNLGNLAFEMGCRYQGAAPNYWPVPDCWSGSQMQCESDGAVVRPGAAAGSRSIRGLAIGSSANLWKNLTFLRAGETVTVRGWVRGVASSPSASVQVIVGNGATFFQVQPPNVFSTPFPCNGAWNSFVITYTVPNNPTYTRLNLALNNGDGGQCWFDDMEVTIQ
jgi:hypothetical protein